MPSISATVVPQPGYVVVEVNFADVPGAEYVCVEREDVLTGSRFPLRPYVAYDTDGCQMLSCGQAILWDTEAPMDRVLRYCATARTADGQVITTAVAPLLADSFTRIVAAGWGTADTGQSWTTSGGAVADYLVNGARGIQSLTDDTTLRTSSAPLTRANIEIFSTVFPAVVALGGSFEARILARRDPVADDDYRVVVRFGLGGIASVMLMRTVGGVTTTLSTILAAYTAITGLQIRFRLWGDQLKVKVWDLTLPEPVAWNIEVTDAAIASGSTIELDSRRNLGNTNGTIDFAWDDLLVTDVCADLVPVEVCGQEVVVPSGGCFRLGDPVRPCNDRVVCLEDDGPCSPDGGIFFGSMGREGFTDNSGQMLPVNSRRPVVVSRRRRDVATTLTLVTATFADRDDLRDLNEPGSPLLWRGPADYGTGDRYMSVTDVTETRSFIDHREQPRVVEMPHLAVDAPVGPSRGVCGTRVIDLCDRYATWNDLAAAGITWADLLRGAVGSGIEVTYATWNDVNAAYADWNALNAGESDWDDAREGIG